MTRDEIILAAKSCTDFDCKSCPLEDDEKCTTNFLNCIIEYMKTEPALSANSTSSEVSKDTNSTHLDDSILLNICQEGLCKVAQTRNADYQIGYADAVLDIIKKLKGGDNNG